MADVICEQPLRSWRVYKVLNASGGLWPSVYTGLNALAENQLRYGVRQSVTESKFEAAFRFLIKNENRLVQLKKSHKLRPFILKS